jgi:hypothetical protein
MENKNKRHFDLSNLLQLSTSPDREEDKKLRQKIKYCFFETFKASFFLKFTGRGGGEGKGRGRERD